MSLSTNGMSVRCDRPGCDSNTGLPVALSVTLTLAGPASDAALGWLFVTREPQQYHYCPGCVAARLAPFLIDDSGHRRHDGIEKGI